MGIYRNGVSRIELITTICIVIMVAFLAVTGVLWCQTQQKKGDDALMEHTAQRVAEANSANTPCVVRNCSGGTNCTHQDENGNYVGYFSHPKNSIEAEIPKGYNEYKKMTVGDKTYYGDVNTMVIRVENRNGKIVLSWVKGK